MCELVRTDVSSEGTKPEQSKNELFAKLERSNTWGDLHMLIGIVGLYSQFLNLY